MNKILVWFGIMGFCLSFWAIIFITLGEYYG